MSTFKKCDKCERKVTKNPADWIYLTVSVSGPQYINKSFDLCPKCAEKIGFKVTEANTRQSIEDRLLDIIYEVVEDVVGNQ